MAAQSGDVAPTIVRDGQFRLFFFSREETRIHVHVANPDGEAKFGLTPESTWQSTLACCQLGFGKPAPMLKLT